MAKQNRKQISYEGKDVFVGLDVHKKTYAVVARVDGEIAKRWTTVADPQKLADQLLKYFQGGRIHTAYEAGFSGLALHRQLTERGIDNLVIHAAGVEVAVNDRVKTDKRDAAKLKLSGLGSQIGAHRPQGNLPPSCLCLSGFE